MILGSFPDTMYVSWERRTMQISRHWRLNGQRYRLEGVRYQNGDVSLQNRPVVAEVRVFDTTRRARGKEGDGSSDQPGKTETAAATVADVTSNGNRT